MRSEGTTPTELAPTAQEITELLEKHALWLVDPTEHSKPSFERLDLRSIKTLKGHNLKQADLSGSTLSGIDLSGACLEKADLSEAICEKTILEDASLREAQCTNTIFKDAELPLADLTSADLNGADFNGAVLDRVNMTNVDAEEIDFSGASLVGASLNGGNFYHGQFKDTTVRQVDLSNADLRYARNLTIDDCTALNAVFEQAASDPWLRLRLTYTGPASIVSLLLFGLFLISITIKSGYFASSTMSPFIGMSPSEIVEYCNSNKCVSVPVWTVLTGWHGLDDLGRITLVGSALFQIVRIGLTYIASRLRYMSERCSRIPPYRAHKPPRVVGSSLGSLWRRVLSSAPLNNYGWLATIEPPVRWLGRVLIGMYIASFSTNTLPWLTEQMLILE